MRERAFLVATRKEVYERQHPETAHGGDRRSSSRQSGDLNDDRFTRETAAVSGRGERSNNAFNARLKAHGACEADYADRINRSNAAWLAAEFGVVISDITTDLPPALAGCNRTKANGVAAWWRERKEKPAEAKPDFSDVA